MKYNRDILVPYLETAYNLELLKGIYLERYSNLYGEKLKLENYNGESTKPAAPFKYSTDSRKSGPIGCAIIMFLVAFCAVAAITNTKSWLLCGGIAAAVAVLTWLSQSNKQKNQAEYYEEEYNKQYQKYEEEMKEYNSIHADDQANIDRISATLEKYESNFNSISGQLERYYSVNIIPSDYRNYESIAYLYRYFSSSNADDLDMIIQTFLLDNVLKTLEEIRNELSDIANQVYKFNDTLSKIEKGISDQNSKLDNMNSVLSSLDEKAAERNLYLRIITEDAEALRYMETLNYYRA